MAWFKKRHNMLIVIITLICWLFIFPVQAHSLSGSTINWVTMGMGLLGGLALFLFGMEQMTNGLKAAAGKRMKKILAKLTTNRFSAALTGALVTALIQSSSVTTVLVIGFISAGLMSLTQSIGIIMGANIGTTMTAQILAFKVTTAALPMIAVGFGMMSIGKSDSWKNYGTLIMGLGLVFFGMTVMSDSMAPLSSHQPFLDLMAEMESPLIGIGVAVLFTALIQSSSATTGIVIVMASQGFITLTAGIALALGADIGTCVTALLAAIGKPREALRAAAVHILFNVIGVLIWIGLISQLANFAIWISPGYPELSSIEKLAAETPRQIANANTAFKGFNVLMFIPFIFYIARFVTWLIPDKAIVKKEIIRTKYLDNILLNTPTMALESVRLELGHIGGIVAAMLNDIKPAFQQKNRTYLENIINRDDQVDVLHKKILEYLGKIPKEKLSAEESQEFTQLMTSASNIEAIGDVIESDLIPMRQEIVRKNIHVSEISKEIMDTLYKTINKAFEVSVKAVSENNPKDAQYVINLKSDIQEMVNQILHHQSQQLVLSKNVQLDALRMEIELLEKFRQIYTLTKRVAKTVL